MPNLRFRTNEDVNQFHTNRLTEYSDLDGANFRNANISENSFVFIYMGNSNFTNANVTYVSFYKTNLEGMITRNTNFTRCFFNYANLTNIVFHSTNFSYASFRNADIRGTNFRDANLTGADFFEAIIDDTTVFPEGFQPNINDPSQYVPYNRDAEEYRDHNLIRPIIEMIELRMQDIPVRSITVETAVNLNNQNMYNESTRDLRNNLQYLKSADDELTDSVRQVRQFGEYFTEENDDDYDDDYNDEGIVANPMVRHGVAYEVHEASNEIIKNKNKLIEIISPTRGRSANRTRSRSKSRSRSRSRSQKKESPQNVYEPKKVLVKLNSNLTKFIKKNYEGDKKQELLKHKDTIIGRLNVARSNDSTMITNHVNLLGASVDFAFDYAQNESGFTKHYVENFIEDSIHAYTGRGDCTSCTKGIIERIFMYLGVAAARTCPDKETCTNETYKKLLNFFYSKITKEHFNRLFKKWYDYITAEIEKDADFYKKMDADARRTNFIDFMKERFREELGDAYNENDAQKQIEDTIAKSEVFYKKLFSMEDSKDEPMLYGGKRIRRLSKKFTLRQNRKTRKSKK